VHKKLRDTQSCGISATIRSRNFVFPFLNTNLKTENKKEKVSLLFLVGMKPDPSHEEAAEGKT
jgi:hypothetical protein